MRPSTDGHGAKRAGGRYVLGDLLGRGGMAEVFSGHAIGDHGFQKPVAIKRLLPELASDLVFVERLIEEAKLLVGMQHGNIVSVLDLARDGDDVFLVMEFVDGPSLRQLLKARGKRGLPLGVATYIVQVAAAGLEFAHGRPGGAVIHADISPSNLLLTTSGEVRVADFGIARREGGGHGVVEGKWAYMAPEQARGEPLTPRSDVFALGVVLYELICGEHPLGRQVTHEERDSQPMRVIPPRVVKPSIPAGIDAICMRALAHDPRDRYARMQQLIDALVEERFSNQYREGASDLARMIREITPGSAIQQARTQITDRPVTIMTRSLLRELTPAGRAASPRLASHSEPTHTGVSQRSIGTPPPVPVIADAGAQTPNAPAPLAHEVGLFELPGLFRAEGAPMPAFRLSETVLPGDELASVVGGATMPGAHMAAEVRGTASNARWTVGILGIAALAGVVLAAVLQSTRDPVASQGAAAGIAVTAPVTPGDERSISDDLRALGDRPQAPLPDVAPAAPDEPAPAADPVPEPSPAAANVASAEPPEPTEAPEEVAAPARNAKRSKVAARRPVRRPDPGTLIVDAAPAWAHVTVDGKHKNTTPRAKFVLAPGRHSLKLVDSESGKTVSLQVNIESNQPTRLRYDWDEDRWR